MAVKFAPYKYYVRVTRAREEVPWKLSIFVVGPPFIPLNGKGILGGGFLLSRKKLCFRQKYRG